MGLLRRGVEIVFRIPYALPLGDDSRARSAVVMLASGVAIASAASNASRRVVGQWGGTGGACCEDHLAFLR